MIELAFNNFSTAIKLIHLSKRKAMKNFANILSIERLNGLFFTRRYNINSLRRSVCIISIWTKKKKKKRRGDKVRKRDLEVIIETSKLSFSFKVTEYRCNLQSDCPIVLLYIETIRIHRCAIGWNERPILYGYFPKRLWQIIFN